MTNPSRNLPTDSLAFIVLIGFVTAVQAMSATLVLPALGASLQTLTGALFSTLAAALYTGTPMSLGLCLAIAGMLSFAAYRLVARRHAPRTLA